MLTDKVSNLNGRYQAVDDLTKRLEEREKVLQSAVTSMEKESTLRQQASECHKRKAVEIGQQCQEMVFKNETLSKQVDDVSIYLISVSIRCERYILNESLSLRKGHSY